MFIVKVGYIGVLARHGSSDNLGTSIDIKDLVKA